MNSELPIASIIDAAANASILKRMEHLYGDLEREIASRGPTCWNRGLCCNFGQFGHRMYVTPLELAWFIANEPNLLMPTYEATICPHKTQNACGARPARPMGCRIFYCQEGTDSWQQAIYESFHRRLVELHRDDEHTICVLRMALRPASIDAN